MKTVDDFQGREKEAVVISLVRSNAWSRGKTVDEGRESSCSDLYSRYIEHSITFLMEFSPGEDQWMGFKVERKKLS